MSSTPFAIESPPVATTVLVVRHAHVRNPANILYGRLPRFRLSDEGRGQARAVARFLSARTLTAIYSSPLLRARQTAFAIADSHPGCRVRTARALLETRSGYQGRSNDILKDGFSFYQPKADQSDETMEDIWQRMIGFVHTAVRRHAGGTVVLVSHADPITILRLGLERREMNVAQLHAATYAGRASVTQLVLLPDGGQTLTYFNIGESTDGPPTTTRSGSS